MIITPALAHLIVTQFAKKYHSIAVINQLCTTYYYNHSEWELVSKHIPPFLKFINKRRMDPNGLKFASIVVYLRNVNCVIPMIRKLWRYSKLKQRLKPNYKLTIIYSDMMSIIHQKYINHVPSNGIWVIHSIKKNHFSHHPSLSVTQFEPPQPLNKKFKTFYDITDSIDVSQFLQQFDSQIVSLVSAKKKLETI